MNKNACKALRTVAGANESVIFSLEKLNHTLEEKISVMKMTKSIYETCYFWTKQIFSIPVLGSISEK